MTTKRSLLVLYLFSFFKSLQFFGAVAVPFYLHRLGLDYIRMFLLEAVFSLALTAFEIPTGVVADRWGRKPSLFFGSLFFGLGFFLFGIFHSYLVLLVAEVVCAFGMSLLSGADRALTYEILRARGEAASASRVMARYDAFGTLGLALAFPAGSLFVASGLVEYKTALGLVFVATAAALAIAGLLVLFVKEPETDRSREKAFRQGIEGFLFIFRKPRLRAFGLNYALLSSTTFFMFWFYQSLLLENHFPVALQGFVAAGFNLTATALLFLTPWAERGLGIKKALFLSSLLPGFLYLGAALVPGLAMALVAIFGVTSLKLFRSPLLSALMNEEIPDVQRATVLSGISMVERISTMLLYPLVGLLADRSLCLALLALGLLTTALAATLKIGENHLGEKHVQ